MLDGREGYVLQVYTRAGRGKGAGREVRDVEPRIRIRMISYRVGI